MKIDRLIGILSVLLQEEKTTASEWMLSCRDKVTVLEPEWIRAKFYQIASDIAKRYEGDMIRCIL